MTVCPCLECGPRHPDVTHEKYVGRDETDGRFADVTLLGCRCGRLWLRYAVEYEAFSSSGRWAAVPISDSDAATMTPEKAPGFIAASPWHVRGGSYFGHAGRRGTGWINW